MTWRRVPGVQNGSKPGTLAKGMKKLECSAKKDVGSAKVKRKYN